eukprot:gene5068-8765_t
MDEGIVHSFAWISMVGCGVTFFVTFFVLVSQIGLSFDLLDLGLFLHSALIVAGCVFTFLLFSIATVANVRQLSWRQGMILLVSMLKSSELEEFSSEKHQNIINHNEISPKSYTKHQNSHDNVDCGKQEEQYENQKKFFETISQLERFEHDVCRQKNDNNENESNGTEQSKLQEYPEQQKFCNRPLSTSGSKVDLECTHSQITHSLLGEPHAPDAPVHHLLPSPTVETSPIDNEKFHSGKETEKLDEDAHRVDKNVHSSYHQMTRVLPALPSHHPTIGISGIRNGRANVMRGSNRSLSSVTTQTGRRLPVPPCISPSQLGTTVFPRQDESHHTKEPSTPLQAYSPSKQQRKRHTQWLQRVRLQFSSKKRHRKPSTPKK